MLINDQYFKVVKNSFQMNLIRDVCLKLILATPFE